MGRKSRKFITESKIFINSGQVGIISTFVATPSSLQPGPSPTHRLILSTLNHRPDISFEFPLSSLQHIRHARRYNVHLDMFGIWENDLMKLIFAHLKLRLKASKPNVVLTQGMCWEKSFTVPYCRTLNPCTVVGRHGHNDS